MGKLDRKRPVGATAKASQTSRTADRKTVGAKPAKTILTRSAPATSKKTATAPAKSPTKKAANKPAAKSKPNKPTTSQKPKPILAAVENKKTKPKNGAPSGMKIQAAKSPQKITGSKTSKTQAEKSNIKAPHPAPPAKAAGRMALPPAPIDHTLGAVAIQTSEKPQSPVRSMTKKARAELSSITLPNGYRPSDDEPFMNAMQRVYFRNKLQSWKEDIIKQNRETLQVLNEDTLQHADIADRATSETDRNLELRARDRQRKLVAKIDSALARIEDGSYGYCEETGEPISLKRLDARPIATLSLEAQERHERRERVYRED
jgi:DnaK suppressor protein